MKIAYSKSLLGYQSLFVIIVFLMLCTWAGNAHAAVDNQPNPDRPGGSRSCGNCGNGGTPTTGFQPFSSNLQADKARVTTGQPVQMTWSVNRARCYTTGGFGGWAQGSSIFTSPSQYSSNGTGPFITNTPGSYTFAYTCYGPVQEVCRGGGGKGSDGCHDQYAYVTKSVNVLVAPPPAPTPRPTLSLTANPISVTPGGTTNLTWSSQNTTSCSASGAWIGNKAVSGSQKSAALTTPGLKTFILRCTGPGGVITKTVGVMVTPVTPPPPPPTVSLTANPISVTPGGTTNLTWSSQNTTSCTASGAWSGNKTTSGTQKSLALNAPGPKTFLLRCVDASGRFAVASAVVTVAVTPPPPPGGDTTTDDTTGGDPTDDSTTDDTTGGEPSTVSPIISADHVLVRSGSPVTISWDSNGVNSCTLSANLGGGSAKPTGSLTVYPTAAATYTISCPNGSSAQVKVDIIPVIYE